MSEDTYKPSEKELSIAASSVKESVAKSLAKAMGDMSHRRLGIAAGVDPKTISRTLEQANAIGVDNLARIALVVGLKPWDMLRPGSENEDAMTMSQLDGFEGQLVTLFRKLSPDEKHDALVEMNNRVDSAKSGHAADRSNPFRAATKLPATPRQKQRSESR